MTVSSTRSGDRAKTNQELRQRVSELEWLVSKQKACFREQRNQLRQQQKSRDLQDNSQKAKVTVIHLTHSNDTEVVCTGSEKFAFFLPSSTTIGL